jgi:hypothetical protein
VFASPTRSATGGPKIINSVRSRYRRETLQQELRRPQQAGRFVTDWHRPLDVGPVRDQVPRLVGGQVHTQGEELCS